MTAISDQDTTRPTVTVEVWSDVVCPWCYIGKRKFASGLAQVESELAECLGQLRAGESATGGEAAERGEGDVLGVHLEEAPQSLAIVAAAE